MQICKLSCNYYSNKYNDNIANVMLDYSAGLYIIILLISDPKYIKFIKKAINVNNTIEHINIRANISDFNLPEITTKALLDEFQNEFDFSNTIFFGDLFENLTKKVYIYIGNFGNIYFDNFNVSR